MKTMTTIACCLAALTAASAEVKVASDRVEVTGLERLPTQWVVVFANHAAPTSPDVQFMTYPTCLTKGETSLSVPLATPTRVVQVGVGRTRLEAGTNVVATVVGTTPKHTPAAPRFTSVSGSAEEPRLVVEIDPLAGPNLVIEGKAELSDGEWRPAARGHRFFRATQK